MAHLSRVGLRLGARHVLRLCNPKIIGQQPVNLKADMPLKQLENAVVRSLCTGTGCSFEIEDSLDFKERVLQAEQPVIVDFHADWCGPCKQLGPRLEAHVEAQHGNVLLAKVNVDDNDELAMDFGVKSIPHVIAIKHGDVVDSFTGSINDEQIEEFIAKLV